MNDDFNTPEALALAWELIKDHTVEAKEKVILLMDFDKILGLGLHAVVNIQKEEIPTEVTVLAEAREKARENKDWEMADAIRKEITDRGYDVNDTDKGFTLKKRN